MTTYTSVGLGSGERKRIRLAPFRPGKPPRVVVVAHCGSAPNQKGSEQEPSVRTLTELGGLFHKNWVHVNASCNLTFRSTAVEDLTEIAARDDNPMHYEAPLPVERPSTSYLTQRPLAITPRALVARLPRPRLAVLPRGAGHQKGGLARRL